MQRYLILLGGLAVAALAVVAIVRESSDEGQIFSAGPDEQERSDGGRFVTVRMEGTEFQPPDVSIGPGQSVRWVNQDDFAHTVTNEEGEGVTFSSGEIAPDDFFEFNFVESDTVNYVCTIHPEMTGTVTIIP